MRLFTFSTTETAAPFCNYDGRHVCGLRRKENGNLENVSSIFIISGQGKKGVKNNRGTTSWDWEKERDVELKCIKEALLPKREQ